MSGQTLTDRIAAAQYSVTGSAVARAVCKATTHEVMGPKKKHLDYPPPKLRMCGEFKIGRKVCTAVRVIQKLPLLVLDHEENCTDDLIQATNETNVNIPQMADTLFERATNTSWVVVFKALVTTHHLMVHGNERFIQYLASRNTLFNLSNFLDKSGSHGYDMSTFIRRYSRYLNEKAFSYRQMAFDFARVHPNELTNGVINAAFMLLFKDLIKLFACYNDGVINLLEKFFEMKKGQCKDALEIYKRFLTRMTRVSEFLKVAEAPSSLMETLEQHLNTLEGKKPGNNASKPSSDLLDLQPDFTSGSAQAASAAPTGGTTSWGDSLAGFSSVTSEPQISDPFAPEPILAPPAATADTATTSATTTGAAAPAAAAEVDLFGDAFAASPGEAPTAPEGAAAPATPTPVAAALDACSGNDPFAPSEGNAEATTELDLFAMKPAETGVPVVTPTTSAATSATSPTPVAAVAPPVPATTAATTATVTTATTSATTTSTTTSAPPPALDIFGDLFESTPAEALAPPKSDAAPSIDLFGTDTFSSSTTGASPGPENSLTGDLLSGNGLIIPNLLILNIIMLTPVDAFAAPSSLPTASPAKVDSSGVIDLFCGFGGSFIAPSPSPSPITPAQANILQPNFEAAFGAAPSPSPAGSSFDSSVFDGLGDLLMPTTMQTGQTLSCVGTAIASASAATKPIGSDLDSSLANLVGNLGISGTTTKKGDLQWNAGEKKLTGGANWQPKVAPATWSSGVPPSGPLTGSVPPAGAGPPTPGAASPQTGSGFGMFCERISEDASLGSANKNFVAQNFQVSHQYQTQCLLRLLSYFQNV
ncbi:hypothetical protein E2320_019433 [Naja naja]|nr:hypothetical protein E2320_019433 [Naja naja]